MLRWFKMEEDAYYLKGPEADPVLAQARMVRTVGRWCATYEHILEIMCLNIQQGVTELQLGPVAGNEPGWTVTQQDLEGELDVVVRCDEGGLNTDAAVKRLDVFFKYLALADRYGQAPYEQIFKWFTRLIAPDLTDSIQPVDVAVDRIKQDERARISQMGTNVPLPYERMADAPQVRLQVLQEWAQYPQTQQWIGQNAMLQEQVQREMEWCQFAIQQTQENAQTGRVGVKGGLEQVAG
jgi:hypothetical protein